MVRLGVDGRELMEGISTGIGRYLIEVLRAVSAVGWECIVYGNCSTHLPVTFPGITLRRVKPGWTPWWDQVALPRRLVQDGVAVFLSPYYKGPLCSPCPTVLTVHDLLFIRHPVSRKPFFNGVMTGLAKLYASRASAIITDSEYGKQSIIELLGINPGKVRVIPLAPNPAFKPTPLTEAILTKYQITSPYILYVGNFKAHKNLPRLLQAYTQLAPDTRKHVQLVLAGGDERNRLVLDRLAEALGITGQVRFPGMIDEQDLPAVYSGAALFVLPSLIEGFGLPALEAMRCGAPVAASNRAAIPEVVGDAAVLFDPEDVTSMIEAMTQILTRRGVRDQLREKGFARASEFCPERTTGQVLALLREVNLGKPQLDSNVSALSPFDR